MSGAPFEGFPSEPCVPRREQADPAASTLRGSFHVRAPPLPPEIRYAFPQFLDFGPVDLSFPHLTRAESGHERYPMFPSGITQLFLRPRPAMTLGRTHSQHVPSFEPDAEFAKVCACSSPKFHPRRMGFIPITFWPEHEYTFGELVADFFQKKNHSNSRFSHKLYNALKIADQKPFYVGFLGVEWISETMLKVDKRAFARLLGIKTIDGSLFHQQGNFPSHGFVQVWEKVARQTLSEADLEGVDDDTVRLLTHQPGIFIRGCTEEALNCCKWVSSRRRA
jgi:hypothetical protein